jgi:hypothetical protein
MKTTITITMEIDGIDPKSDAASTFLDHVESAFDRTAYNLRINRYWFAIEGGETRHMPDDQDR